MPNGKDRVTVEPLIQMHGAMPEILPCIESEDGKSELKGRDDCPVQSFCNLKLPWRECRCRHDMTVPIDRHQKAWIVPASQYARKVRALLRDAVSQCRCVKAKDCKDVRDCTLRRAYPLCPDMYVILLLANHDLRFEESQHQAEARLDDLLYEDISENFVPRDVVPC